jgi:hypothetical protein
MTGWPAAAAKPSVALSFPRGVPLSSFIRVPVVGRLLQHGGTTDGGGGVSRRLVVRMRGVKCWDAAAERDGAELRRDSRTARRRCRRNLALSLRERYGRQTD